jgi:phosphoribosylformylglycinamidine cyclo-ligase
MQEQGDIKRDEMYGTFNMGLGFLMVVDSADVDAVMESLASSGEKAYRVGEIVPTGADGERVQLWEG